MKFIHHLISKLVIVVPILVLTTLACQLSYAEGVAPAQDAQAKAMLQGALTQPQSQPAVAKNIEGEVFIQKAGAGPDQWTPLTKTMPLNSGDTVKTENGSCLIIYAEQANIRLSAFTTITIQDNPETHDILLHLGNLNARVDAEKAKKPFQFVTPTAISAVRGTDVDFGFDEDGLLTIDLHDGNVLVFNQETDLELDLDGGKKVAIYYDYATGSLSIRNDCVSSGDIEFIFQGKTYTTKPCDEIITEVATAAGEGGYPQTPGDDDYGEDVPTGISPTR